VQASGETVQVFWRHLRMAQGGLYAIMPKKLLDVTDVRAIFRAGASNFP
jgi:hypothetical protein